MAVLLESFSVQSLNMLHFELSDMPLFKQLPEIQKWVVSLWRLEILLHVIGDRSHHEVIICFQRILIGVLIKCEKPISVDGVVDHVSRWQTTKFDDFKHLVVIVFSWKYWRIDKKLDCCASQRPHIDALIISRRLFTSNSVGICIASQKDFRRSVVP